MEPLQSFGFAYWFRRNFHGSALGMFGNLAGMLWMPFDLEPSLTHTRVHAMCVFEMGLASLAGAVEVDHLAHLVLTGWTYRIERKLIQSSRLDDPENHLSSPLCLCRLVFCTSSKQLTRTSLQPTSLDASCTFPTRKQVVVLLLVVGVCVCVRLSIVCHSYCHSQVLL